MLFFDDTASLRKVVEEARTQGVGLFLVKEQGIYLVASRSDGSTCIPPRHVTYAKGCNPDRDKSWRNTARKLIGEDDFAHHLSVNSICTQILEHDAQLRAVILGQRVALLCGEPTNLSLAEYRNLTDRLFTLAVAHFSACVSKEEFICWRSMALRLLSEAAFISCSHAKHDNQRKFMSACVLLHHRLNCVTTDGVLCAPN